MAEEIRVVVVGKTGVGKSALGNKILNKNVFCSQACSQSVTKEAKRGERMIDNDHKLVLVDTPGLFDTRNNDNMDTAKILTGTVKVTKPGPHMFIFVLSINSRFTAEEKASIEFLKYLFGNSITDYLIIIFTGKDSLDHHGKSLQGYIDEADDYLKILLSQCRGRVAINNRAQETQSVGDILQLIIRVYQQNGKEHYTDEMMTEAREKFEEKLRLQEDESGKTERKLKEEICQNQKTISKLNNELEELYKKEIRIQKNDEEKIKSLEQEKKDIKKYYDDAIKRKLKEDVKIAVLRKNAEEAQKKYEDEKKENEKIRLQLEDAHRRERTDDKNIIEALRKDIEETQKKYENEKKRKGDTSSTGRRTGRREKETRTEKNG